MVRQAHLPRHPRALLDLLATIAESPGANPTTPLRCTQRGQFSRSHARNQQCWLIVRISLQKCMFRPTLSARLPWPVKSEHLPDLSPSLAAHCSVRESSQLLTVSQLLLCLSCTPPTFHRSESFHALTTDEIRILFVCFWLSLRELQSRSLMGRSTKCALLRRSAAASTSVGAS